MTRLSDKYLSNPLINAVFQSSAAPIYLVGGYIRDIQSGRQSKDMDFVVKNALDDVIEKLSLMFDATVVVLGKEKEPISRLVLKDSTTLDFSMMKNTIQEDLDGRDFTFNAMAWSPMTGLIDHHGGIDDVNKGIVRGISKENFMDDPLRLLRAYRFSAENSWDIDKDTKRIIRSMAGEIRRAASERITLEFFKLLNASEPFKALESALKDGVLTEIISLPDGRLRKNLKLVSRIYTNLEKIPETHYLKFASQGLNYTGLLRLEQILLGTELQENRLSLSKALSSRIHSVNSFYERFRKLDLLQKAETYDLFSEAGEAGLDLIIITEQTSWLDEFRRFQRIKRKGLLSGDEIIMLKNIQPGPELGMLIHSMKRMQFEGVFSRKREAERWLKNANPDNVIDP